jgi:PDZ domain-containing protein
MKQTIANSKIEFMVLTIILVLFFTASIIKVDYSYIAPGYNDDVASFIEIDDGYQSSGSIHTTSVIAPEQMTSLQYVMSFLFPDNVISNNEGRYDNVDIDDITIMGYLMKDDSIANSLIVGAENAGFNVSYTIYNTIYLTYSYIEEDTLVIGDEILSINGLEPDLETFDFDSIACGERANFVVKRDDEILTFDVLKQTLDDGCAFGFRMSPFTEITNTDFTYTIAENNTGGPSGGLMQALYVYNELTELDITKGYKIAGTGTIDVDGNVGSIGGVKQKILTAYANDIDIFFVPNLSDSEFDNYNQALEMYNTLSTTMKLVPVDSFEDALAYLNQIEVKGE